MSAVQTSGRGLQVASAAPGRRPSAAGSRTVTDESDSGLPVGARQDVCLPDFTMLPGYSAAPPRSSWFSTFALDR